MVSGTILHINLCVTQWTICKSLKLMYASLTLTKLISFYGQFIWRLLIVHTTLPGQKYWNAIKYVV